MFGIDFSNHQKHGFVVTLASYSLCQLWKTINNFMNAACGMTLQKSTDAHKVAGQNNHTKRKNKCAKMSLWCFGMVMQEKIF